MRHPKYNIFILTTMWIWMALILNFDDSGLYFQSLRQALKAAFRFAWKPWNQCQCQWQVFDYHLVPLYTQQKTNHQHRNMATLGLSAVKQILIYAKVCIYKPFLKFFKYHLNFLSESLFCRRRSPNNKEYRRKCKKVKSLLFVYDSDISSRSHNVCP